MDINEDKITLDSTPTPQFSHLYSSYFLNLEESIHLDLQLGHILIVLFIIIKSLQSHLPQGGVTSNFNKEDLYLLYPERKSAFSLQSCTSPKQAPHLK